MKKSIHQNYFYPLSGNMTTSFTQKKIMEVNVDNLTWQFHNEFIPSYVPPIVKYFERDGLETWYRQNKCQEFLQSTNKHFKQRKIVNFHMIKEKLDKKVIQQYQTVDNNKIEQYPIEYRNQIRCSIFCNIHRNDLHVEMSTVKTIL